MKHKIIVAMLSVALIVGLVLCASPVAATQDGKLKIKVKLTDEKVTAFEWLDANQDIGAEITNYIWHHPELGLGEHESSAVLQDFLARNDFSVEADVAGMETAFVASWGQGEPVIGIHAEYDALPGISQVSGSTEREPVLEGAPGHGCHHNLFGAYSCMAGVAIKEAMAEHGITGTIKVFGTPAEETLVGKAFMVKAGLYDDVDIVLSWHPGSGNSVSYGSSLAMDNFKVRFYGVSSHAASAPWAGRSALDAVELMDIAMNYMREHVRPECRIMYCISYGGGAPNVVPPYAEVWYFVRAPHYTMVQELMVWTEQIAEGAALMTQTDMEFIRLTGVWEMLPNQVLAKLGDANVELTGAPPFTDEDQAIGEPFSATFGITEGPFYSDTTTTPFKQDYDVDQPFKWATGGGSIDEANVSWVVPMVRFSAATKARGTPGHTWQQVAQGNLPPAFKGGLTVSKYIAATALDLYDDPDLIDAAWAELEESNAKWGPFVDPVADIDVPSFLLMHGVEEDAVPKQWEVLPYPYPFE